MMTRSFAQTQPNSAITYPWRAPITQHNDTPPTIIETFDDIRSKSGMIAAILFTGLIYPWRYRTWLKRVKSRKYNARQISRMRQVRGKTTLWKLNP